MKRYIHLLLAITGVMVITACSTEKNTAKSRWWQAFNTRYNTYYNGTLAYIDGSLAKETGNKDNFTEIIPLYTVSNKASRELGKGEFDKAIEKAEKAIKLHSIKRKPEWTKNRRKTEKDLEWLNRKEYNPFLWKAWMLMGRSQFFQGDFDGAASTFNYMSRLYATQPAIYGRARAWLAKCYIENDFLYDAEDIIRNMQRDSLHWRARKEWDYTYADYYIHTADYAKAIPYLRNVIKHEMRKKQRAREWYLMGQLQAALGNKAEARHTSWSSTPRLPKQRCWPPTSRSKWLGASSAWPHPTTTRIISTKFIMPSATFTLPRKTPQAPLPTMRRAPKRPHGTALRKVCCC